LQIAAVPLHEDDLIRSAEANGFRVTEAWSPPRPIPAHAHRELSITILLSGAFEERYRPVHALQECSAGSLLVRPAGEPHENQLGREGGQTLSIELDPRRLEACGEPAARLSSLAHRRDAAFLDLGWAMSRELGASDAARTLALESLCLELLARLLRTRDPAERSCPLWLEQARSFLHDQFREGSLRVADLAAAQGVHPVSLARAFRRHFGVTPGEYVRRLRLEEARRRVEESRDPLAEVAAACGFSDQSHLTRAFRRRFGAPPGRRRRVGPGV
jgi:AraC family transcriptional regulator